MQQSPKMLIGCVGISLVIIIGYAWSRINSSSQINVITESKAEVDIPKDLASGDTNNDLLHSIMARQEGIDKAAEDLKKGVTELEKSKQDAAAEHNEMIEKINQYSEQTKKMISDAKLSVKDIGIAGYDELKENVLSTDDNIIKEVVDISSKPVVINDDLPGKNTTIGGLPTLSHPISGLNNDDQENKPKTSNLIPYITIPKTSTLADVKLMTSLIAQIPVSGKLLTPAFPFKAIVGRKDLMTANGINIPKEASGIVLEGYSVGDMSLSCARGYITGLLFVFDDGRFVSFPETNLVDGTEVYPKDAIGYISNEDNLTCLPGKYISNANKVLASQAMMGAVAGGGQALAQAQLSTMTNSFQTSQALTQDSGKFIAGGALSGLAEKTLTWYNERIHDVFDAVYVPAVKNAKPNTVTVHITKTINIDYDKTGRKISNDNFTKNSTYVGLD